MRLRMKIGVAAFLAFAWNAAFAQTAPYHINCAPSTPCSETPPFTGGPVNTGTGDPAYVGGGKINYLFDNINTWLTLPFSSVTGGTTSASMLIGSGGSLGPSGTAILTANAIAPSVQALGAQSHCQLVATSNVASLSGLPFLDGINGIAGQANSCVLLQHQTTGSQNGPWCFASSGPWTRCPYYSSGSTTQAAFGMTVDAIAGNQYINSVWHLDTPSPVTIDTTGNDVDTHAPARACAGIDECAHGRCARR